MKRLLSGIMSCVVAFSCIGGGVNAKEVNETENASLSTEFKLLEKMPQNENFVFSPLSIKLAFMLAANGAENETQKEILDAFDIANLEEGNPKLKETVDSLTSNGTVNIANSVWLNNDYMGKDVKFRDEYLNSIKNYYNAEAREVNNSNAVNSINSWVNDKTNGKIKEVIDDPNFLSALVNAVHFKADWQKTFDKDDTIKRIFTDKNGKDSKVDFMQQKGIFNYYEDDELQLLEMKYKDTDLSMYIALPKAGKEITQENFQRAIDNKKPERVDIKLPKFKTETSMELNDIMKALGIKKAFDEKCSDFNNVMFKNIPEGISSYISKVIHKSFIQVDEKGTEAAAVTAIMIKCMSCCPFEPVVKYHDFNANHPFKYLIKDNQNNEILFMGEQAFFN